MSETRVQRRLVKSPPELWAEVSDADALGRRLDRFGEIRITRVEPETTVAWEGEAARGTVEIEASGWGTRVTITAEVVETAAAQEPAAPVQPVAEPAEPEPVAQEPQPEPVAVEPEPEPVAPEPEPEPEAVLAEPGPAPVAVTPAPPSPAPTIASPAHGRRRGGLFARLFRRSAPVSAPAPAPAPTPPPATVAVVAEPAPEPIEPEPEPISPEPEPVAVEPVAVEPEPAGTPALTAAETTSALEAVLDDLGSAHHRPFSRG